MITLQRNKSRKLWPCQLHPKIHIKAGHYPASFTRVSPQKLTALVLPAHKSYPQAKRSGSEFATTQDSRQRKMDTPD